MKEIYSVQGNEKIGYRIAVPTRLKKSDRYRIEMKSKEGALLLTPVKKKAQDVKQE